MAPSLTLAFMLLAGAYGATVPQRIVGGEETSIDQYPSIVAVESLGTFTGIWGQSCAASILNSHYLVSAAHCFDGVFYVPERRRIRAGSSHRNTGGQVHQVAREHNHPTYGQLGYDGDITVVALVTPLEYNPVVQQASIIMQDYVMADNTAVIHAGWGTTSSGGTLSEVLRDVTIYTVNHELCVERYANRPTPAVVTKNMICAGILDVGGKDACQGDSGGPLYFPDGSNQLILVGVVSWGHGCADAHYPGVSTSISSYTDWIVSTAASM